MPVIDFHAHAFPDALARRAVPQLAAESNIKPHLDGTLGRLLASMDAAGIDQAVVASIATRPEQFAAILKWSTAIASNRVLPFTSIHPDDPQPAERVKETAKAGLYGIKLHPYYQGFTLDEPRLEPLYSAVSEAGLPLLVHCGFDEAYPREKICNPARVRAVAEAFPNLKLIAAHLGGWMDWDEAERELIGRPVTLDLAAVLGFMPDARARRLLLAHPREHIVFGTDSPWFGQAQELAKLRALQLPADVETAILHKNAARLLRLPQAA